MFTALGFVGIEPFDLLIVKYPILTLDEPTNKFSGVSVGTLSDIGHGVGFVPSEDIIELKAYLFGLGEEFPYIMLSTRNI